MYCVPLAPPTFKNGKNPSCSGPPFATVTDLNKITCVNGLSKSEKLSLIEGPMSHLTHYAPNFFVGKMGTQNDTDFQFTSEESHNGQIASNKQAS